mmetsp:Transcript_6983/g.19596  ORF Transcript_6983/g.19596 Transcript_6983/m.19596 type:complete len:289 (+) Transcript_6983:204-1070(+)
MMQTQTTSTPQKLHEICDRDILCSKDKSLASHPGNRIFREQIEKGKVLYEAARDKTTKMKITKDIIKHIQTDLKCRFVKFDTESGSWLEVTPNEARDKVGHALRFAIKGSRKASARRRSLAELAKQRRKPLRAGSLPARLPSTIAELPAQRPLKRASVSLEDFGDIYQRQQQILQKLDGEDFGETFNNEAWSTDSDTTNDMIGESVAVEVASMEPLQLNDPSSMDPAHFFTEDDLNLLTRVINQDGEVEKSPLEQSSFLFESFEMLKEASKDNDEMAFTGGASNAIWR